MERLVASPVCNPELGMEDAFALYADIGFSKFEAFIGWTGAAVETDRDPAHYRRLAEGYGLRFASVHLPRIEAQLEESLQEAVRTAEFAAALGADVILFKAVARDDYARAGKPFLDRIEGLELTAAIQNHAGSPISSPADIRAVLAGIDDPRMQGVLEVGHLHQAGHSWQEGARALAGRIALVHIKDIRDGECVPFGEGEVDFPALFQHLRSVGYGGDFVVELEGPPREQDAEGYLRKGVSYLSELLES